MSSIAVTRVRYFQPCSPVVSQNSLNIILATVLGRAGGGAAVTSSGSELAGSSSATHTWDTQLHTYVDGGLAPQKVDWAIISRLF